MPNPIIDVANRQKQELINRQEQLVNRLGSVYAQVIQDLDVFIEALNLEILNQTQNGQELSSSKLFRMSRYQSLQAQVIEQLQRYGTFADIELRSEIVDMMTLGSQHSFTLVRDQFQSLQGRRALTNTWDQLSTDQIETALSFLTSDSPFNQILSQDLGEGIATRIEDAIIKSVIVGKNPRATASIIRNELGLGLAWSLNTARTAQIYSYRTTTSLNYRNNANIVDSWTWLAALDRRTCTSCIAQHGTRHPVEEILNDHHQGRCTQIPNIKDPVRFGIDPIDVETGETWFGGLDENLQRDIMGEGRYNAWRRNDFDFSSMSSPYENNIYGTMLRESTLQELTGG